MSQEVFIALIIIGVFLAINLVFGVFALINNLRVKKETKTILLSDLVSSFDINLETANIEFKVSNDALFKVESFESNKYHHKAEVKGNLLTINVNDEREWFEKFLDFKTYRDLKVVLYLPSNIYDNLLIKSTTGDVMLPHDFSFKNVDIRLTTGNIGYNSNALDQIKIKSTTGNIYVNNVKTSKISTHSTTGRISFKNVEVKGDISIKSTTGSIELTNTISRNGLKIDSTTGNIRLEEADASKIDIEATTGNVKGTLLSSKIFNIDTTTGHINVPSSREGGVCNITTTTGDINIKIQ